MLSDTIFGCSGCNIRHSALQKIERLIQSTPTMPKFLMVKEIEKIISEVESKLEDRF